MPTSYGQAVEACRVQTGMASLAGCQLTSVAALRCHGHGQRSQRAFYHQEPGLLLVEALSLPPSALRLALSFREKTARAGILLLTAGFQPQRETFSAVPRRTAHKGSSQLPGCTSLRRRKVFSSVSRLVLSPRCPTKSLENPGAGDCQMKPGQVTMSGQHVSSPGCLAPGVIRQELSKTLAAS